MVVGAYDSFIISLYLGGIALLFFITSARFWFILNRLRLQIPKQIGQLVSGASACVVGHVIAPQKSLIRSPYSDTTCVGFIAHVQQKLSHFDARKGFLSSEWSSVGTSVRTSPFLVKDATGTICVLATRAQLSLSRTVCGELDVQHTFRPVSPLTRWVARRIAPIQSLWISECLLCEGDAVFVSGVVRPVTQLDAQFIPSQFLSSVTHVLKGSDVVISTTVPASHIPFYEKCFLFCLLSGVVCILLFCALLFLF